MITFYKIKKKIHFYAGYGIMVKENVSPLFAAHSKQNNGTSCVRLVYYFILYLTLFIFFESYVMYEVFIIYHTHFLLNHMDTKRTTL